MSTFTDPAPASVTPVVTATVTLDGSETPLSGEVSQWSTTRELVGSVLPGNLRTRSGLSIGTASVAVRNPDPITRTPWASNGARIRRGGEVSLAAEVTGEVWPMGSWLIGEATGSLRSAEVPMSLRESSFRGRGDSRSVRNLLPVVPATPVEPAWMVDALARQVGWWTTPAPVESCLASLPLNGAVWSELSDYVAFPLDGTVPKRWGGVRGALGPIGDWGVYLVMAVISYRLTGGVLRPTYDPVLIDDTPLYVTLCATGGPTLIRFGYGATDPQLRIDPDDATLEVRSSSSSAWVSVGYVPGLDPNNLDRVQIEVQRSGSPTDPDSEFDFRGTYGPIRARARSSQSAAWSAWAVDSTTVAGNAVSELIMGSTAADGGSAAGVQVTREADPALWAPATAHIEPLGNGGLMPSPWLASDVDVWSGIQAVCAAWLGAAWVDAAGILICRNRSYLAGLVPPSSVPVLDVGTRVEDLPWTLDPADEADRLTVTYAPVDILTLAYDPDAENWSGTGSGNMVAPLLWESSEAVQIGPGETITIKADVENLGVAAGVYQQPYGLTQNWWSAEVAQDGHWQVSSWNARPNRDGTGAIPGEGALQVTSRQVSAGRVLIEIRNRTGSALWTVDGKGNPWLRMRVVGMTSQANAAVVTRGLPEEQAVNPMAIDLGRLVQRQADAEAIADYLWGRARNPGYRVASLRVVPDWRRDIGDVIYLTHGRSGLAQKALITKVAMAGKPGEVTQHLDVVLLPVTYADHTDYWAGKTYAQQKAARAGDTYRDETDDPLKGA